MATNIKITSYNPEKGQTDSTPCKAGGTGYDLCEMSKKGLRPIALSQEMAAWSTVASKQGTHFKAGDVITLKSIDQPHDTRCNGDFIVSDAMNIRYRKRADLFMPTRASNTSCSAHVYFSGKNIHSTL